MLKQPIDTTWIGSSSDGPFPLPRGVSGWSS